MRFFASTNKTNVLYVRSGQNKSQFFKPRHGGETVEMEKISDYDYRAVFSDGRVTVIPMNKLPLDYEGWQPMPRKYFPSKGDWDHMETDPTKELKQEKKKVRKRKMTLAEMLEEMNA